MRGSTSLKITRADSSGRSRVPFRASEDAAHLTLSAFRPISPEWQPDCWRQFRRSEENIAVVLRRITDVSEPPSAAGKFRGARTTNGRRAAVIHRAQKLDRVVYDERYWSFANAILSSLSFPLTRLVNSEAHRSRAYARSFASSRRGMRARW